MEEQKLKVINVLDTDNMLDDLLELKREKKFKGTIQEFIDSLDLSSHIYVDASDNVVPYSMIGDTFVCASEDEGVIGAAIKYATRDITKLKSLSKKDELTGKYFNKEKLMIDGQTYTEEVPD